MSLNPYESFVLGCGLMLLALGIWYKLKRPDRDHQNGAGDTHHTWTPWELAIDRAFNKEIERLGEPIEKETFISEPRVEVTWGNLTAEEQDDLSPGDRAKKARMMREGVIRAKLVTSGGGQASFMSRYYARQNKDGRWVVESKTFGTDNTGKAEKAPKDRGAQPPAKPPISIARG